MFFSTIFCNRCQITILVDVEVFIVSKSSIFVKNYITYVNGKLSTSTKIENVDICVKYIQHHYFSPTRIKETIEKGQNSYNENTSRFLLRESYTPKLCSLFG